MVTDRAMVAAHTDWSASQTTFRLAASTRRASGRPIDRQPQTLPHWIGPPPCLYIRAMVDTEQGTTERAFEGTVKDRGVQQHSDRKDDGPGTSLKKAGDAL